MSTTTGASDGKECLFCPGFFEKSNKVLHRESGWAVISNLWPYENTEVHLLLIPERHIIDIGDVTPEDWDAIREMNAWARNEYNALMDGGALLVRYGLRSGVTVRHLHFHLVTAKVNPETGEVSKGKHIIFSIG